MNPFNPAMKMESDTKMEPETQRSDSFTQKNLIRSMNQQIQSLIEALSLSENQKTILQQQIANKDQEVKESTKNYESLMKALFESEKQKKLMLKPASVVKKLPQTIPSCSKNHPLRYVTVKTAVKTYHSECAQCDKNVGPSSMCWECLPCEVLYCIKCKGYRKNVCTFGHELQFAREYMDENVTCDVCDTKRIKCGWNCECDFDMCEACYEKA